MRICEGYRFDTRDRGQEQEIGAGGPEKVSAGKIGEESTAHLLIRRSLGSPGFLTCAAAAVRFSKRCFNFAIDGQVDAILMQSIITMLLKILMRRSRAGTSSCAEQLKTKMHNTMSATAQARAVWVTDT